MTQKKLPAVSPAETEILRLVWQLNKATVQEVCDKLPAKRKIRKPLKISRYELTWQNNAAF